MDQTDRDELVEQLPGRSLTDNLKLAGGIGIIGAFIIFLLQNTEDAQIDFLFWGWEIPLFFALLLAAALGAIIGWLFTTFRRRARRREREMFDRR